MRPPSKMSRHFWYQSSAKSGHTYHFRMITFRISPTSSATTYYDYIPKKPRRLNRSLSTTTSKQRDQSTPIRDAVLLIDQTQEIITIAARFLGTTNSEQKNQSRQSHGQNSRIHIDCGSFVLPFPVI